MDTPQLPRALTHDEQKAAEAAFGGRPFNPAWSASAKKVYDGLMRALPSQSGSSDPFTATPEENSHAPAADEAMTETEAAPTSESADAIPSEEEESGENILAKREEAIRAGFLIDVTADAKKVGITFPVTMTKPLWEVGIAPSALLSDQDRAERLRDVLMAFRLRLANQSTLSPLIDFPALLALPPGSVPEPIPLFALIQPHEQHQALVTLLLPNEVSTTIMPLK